MYYDTTLRCDHPRCVAKLRYYHHWRYARARAAREHGWAYHHLLGDFCADHATEGRPLADEQPLDGHGQAQA